jgi:polar amino acid transport system substrate-binding protein
MRRRGFVWMLAGFLVAAGLAFTAIVVVQQRPQATVPRATVVTPSPTPGLPALLVAPPALTWGGDATLGAPQVFADPQHPSQVQGLEADLIAAIAKRLHLRAQFQQVAWEDFPRALHSRQIDLFADDVIPSELPQGVAIYTPPYLMMTDAIVVRAGDTRFTDLTSLTHHQVGIITGDRAAGDLAAYPAVTVVAFTNTLPFEELAAGRIDAVVVSAPLAGWYGTRDAQQRFTVLPATLHPAPVTLALAISHAQSFALRPHIAAALAAMRCDGSLKAILTKWGLTSTAELQFAVPAKGKC